MPNDKLENERVQAEARKFKAETDKLIAEKDEIISRTQSDIDKIASEKKNVFREYLSGWTGVGLAIMALVSGTVTIWINYSSFLEQRKKEAKFAVTTEMVKLVETLSSKDKYKEENAVLLFSHYDEYAIPILILNLDRTDYPDATIESLRLVKEKLNSNKVIDELYVSAEKIFDREYENPDVKYISFINYVSALGVLGNESEKKEDITGLLKTARDKINEKNNVTPARKKLIIEAIDIALKKLGMDLITH